VNRTFHKAILLARKLGKYQRPQIYKQALTVSSRAAKQIECVGLAISYSEKDFFLDPNRKKKLHTQT
jgi:hypothetical protein